MLQSPRWLLMQDRTEDALASLKKLRGDNTEMSPEAELQTIRASLIEEIDTGAWKDLLRGHNRRRTLVVIGVAFFFQGTGNSFSGHYSGIFVKSLSTVNPLNITVAQTALNTFTSFIGILVIDRMGRRKLWTIGSVLLFLTLMASGGLGVPKPISYSLSQGIVATLLIYQMVYAATIAPLYYTLITELAASRLRDKTVRVGALVNISTM